MAWIKSHPLAVVAASVGGATVVYLAFAVFGVHTLFVDKEIDEAGPVFESGAAPSGITSDMLTEEQAAEMTETMTNEPVVVEATEGMPEMEIESATAGADEETARDMIETILTGNFVDRSHPTAGRVDVLNDGTAQRFLRFEDFESDNGPDLNVYLSTAPSDAPAGDFGTNFVDLGDLKGNVGSQNYEIPVDVDLDVHSTVVIWCVRFGVAFGAAELNAIG